MKIELRSVVKSYGRNKVLDHVSLEILPGQIVGVLGINGAGTSTMLRCLSGIAVPDKGEILYDGENFDRRRLDLRRRLHFLPDIPFQFWDQSILRNLAIVLRVYDEDKPGKEKEVLEYLTEMDLLPLSLRAVGTLSRGQAYKSALAALFSADRELWLLDEPFASGMDPNGIDIFRKRAREAARRGRTIIYSTQLLDVAERFSDRVCVIHQGEIRAFDTLDNLRAKSEDKENVLAHLFRQFREEGK